MCISIKLNDIVNEYNNTYHRTIKMKPVDLKNNTYIDSNKELMIKTPNLKSLIMKEPDNTKIFLLNDTLRTGLKKSL